MLTILFGLLAGSFSHAAGVDIQAFKAKCIVGASAAESCVADLRAYCSQPGSPVAKENCQKLGAYFNLKAKSGDLRHKLVELFSNQKVNKVEFDSYSVDLAPVFPAFDKTPQNVVLAISEQCVLKNGAGKGQWNSYQLQAAGKVQLAPELVAKRAEVEGLIRKYLPDCKNPGQGMEIVSVVYLSGMAKPEVWYLNQDKSSLRQLESGLAVPELQ